MAIKRLLLERVIKTGRSVFSPNISLRFLKNEKTDGKTPGFFSFVISAKAFKRAVDRNFIKRRGRHIIQLNRGRMKGDFTGMFMFKKGYTIPSFAEMRGEIEFLLKKANMI